MQKYLIVVEGKADVSFLKDYLIHLDNNLNIKKEFNNKDKTIVIGKENIEIKILVGGGYTAILEQKILTILKMHQDDGYNILVIQDADNPNKNHGGVENRIKYLNDLSVEFETFLFPNHQDDGDLETLLLTIVKNEKYENFFACYKEYVNCIKKATAINCIEELLEDKHKVFSYFCAYSGMENSKEENRKYEADYWDFKSDKLNPLKDFFEKNLFNE